MKDTQHTTNETPAGLPDEALVDLDSRIVILMNVKLLLDAAAVLAQGPIAEQIAEVQRLHKREMDALLALRAALTSPIVVTH